MFHLTKKIFAGSVVSMTKVPALAVLLIAAIGLGEASAKDVEAGPIWNQADAEKKCPALARRHQSRWNGQWRTTVPNKMSVCGLQALVYDVNAGPIWNQADAQTKCSAIAARTKGKWNGQWRTTVQGKVSVCGMDYRIQDVNAGPIWSQADAQEMSNTSQAKTC